jgi:osmotically-inducible protein OsmY
MPRLALPMIAALALAACGRSASPSAQADAAPTAMDQGDSATDRDLTRRIRQSLMADDRLSFAAKNVVIVARQGHVTLLGHVGAMEEKAEIGVRARQIAGIELVDNRIEVGERE